MDSRRKNETSALVIRLNERRVGVIARLADDRNIFAFDEDYIEDTARPTMSLSFKTASGGLVTDIKSIRTRLPPFFSNLLPEGHLREYLAVRAGVKPEREFFLLDALGADLPGAVTALPLDADTDEDRRGVRDRSARDESGVLRFSLAGVQLKFSAIAEVAGGLTIPASGIGGSWIVKLPSMRFPAVPENEFVMMELARRVGIPVPRVRLVPVREISGLPEESDDLDGNALAVERFDRLPDGGRVHIEDFAQVFGLFPERKYEQRNYASIAAVLWAEAGEEAVDDFMRRLTFSVLIGNGDMHLKNWSLIYRDGCKPALSPAYDFVATLPYLPKDRLALNFGGGKNIHGVTRTQVRRLADAAGLAVNPLWRIARETADQTVAAWRAHDAREVLSRKVRTAVGRHLERAAAHISGAGPP